MGWSHSLNGQYQNTEKSTGWKVPWKKTCGKTVTEMGKHQKGLLIAAEYKRMEKTSRG
jgi:hypothetical protein